MLDQRQAQQRGDKAARGDVEAVAMQCHGDVPGAGRQGRDADDADREQGIAAALAEVAVHIAQMLGQKLLVQVAHPEEDIQFCRQPHQPQHAKCPRRKLVGLVPAQGQNGRTQHDQRELVIQDGHHRVARTAPAASARRAGMPARPGHVAEQEANLLPGPDHQRGGECQIGPGDARVRCRHRHPHQCNAQQHRGRREGPGVGGTRQAVQVQDQAGAEPPQQQGVERRPTVLHIQCRKREVCCISAPTSWARRASLAAAHGFWWAAGKACRSTAPHSRRTMPTAAARSDRRAPWRARPRWRSRRAGPGPRGRPAAGCPG
mmetsp:Transcript_11615/g.46921  ORF Transcript_11615/g.46921 Transcript_11615/m.46921 type:complete len:318 (-) Transcript_11615:1310-2263(-)